MVGGGRLDGLPQPPAMYAYGTSLQKNVLFGPNLEATE